jgi:outer membrane protein assembly factor BamB
VNDTVYVASSDGKVFGRDIHTGVEVWAGQSPEPINYDSENGGPMPPSGPAAGEGVLVFQAGHTVVAWKLEE